MATQSEDANTAKRDESRSNSSSILDKSLIIGIVLIALFLGVFMFEFSNILMLEGRVEHSLPVQKDRQTSTNTDRP